MAVSLEHSSDQASNALQIHLMQLPLMILHAFSGHF